ncbi:MAG: FUSC family protein [Gracilibacteraceae bacterium]|jgi:uncharacterized membrane protein YgaE (UPF0421/DUF939 family)|nr:FUSC family protein [Gracilibacteraceae bacterium]
MDKNLLLRGLGLRSIKTALSVFLCIPVLLLMGIEQPFFACIAAVVATQTTVQQSFAIGLERIVGTIAGAAWALIFTLLAPPPLNPVDLTPLQMLFTGFGVTLVIYSTNVLQMPNAGSIGSIVFIGIMINLLPGQTPVETAVLRTAETLLGVIIAMLVNWLVFPYKQPAPEKDAPSPDADQPPKSGETPDGTK